MDYSSSSHHTSPRYNRGLHALIHGCFLRHFNRYAHFEGGLSNDVLTCCAEWNSDTAFDETIYSETIRPQKLFQPPLEVDQPYDDKHMKHFSGIR